MPWDNLWNYVRWLAPAMDRTLRFKQGLEDPAEAQRERLLKYMASNRNTLFGMSNRFGQIHTVQAYQERVPISDYEDFEGYINQMANGHPDVLTRSKVQCFEVSSGSTAPAKLIPYTVKLQKEFQRSLGPWMINLYRQYPTMMTGKAFWVSNPVSQETKYSPAGIPIGFEESSDYIGGEERARVLPIMAMPQDVQQIDDMDSHLYVTLLFLLQCTPLTFISIQHPIYLIRLWYALETFQDQLIFDMEYGSITPPEPLPEGLHDYLMTLRVRQPNRAHKLRRLDKTTYWKMWPKLKVLSCWGDGYAATPLDTLREWFPHVHIQPKGIMATEALVSIPYDGQYPLAITSHFFEFLDGNGNPLLAQDLEEGGRYEVLVTTGGGLYRYRLRDRVEVTGFLKKTPTLKLLGKDDLMSDRFGEKLDEGFVQRIVGNLLRKHNIHPVFSLFAFEQNPTRSEDPEVEPNSGRYVLFLEVQLGRPIPEVLDEELHLALCTNPNYKYLAELGQLSHARVFRIFTGGLNSYAKQLKQLRQGESNARIEPLPKVLLSRFTGWAKVFQGQYMDRHHSG